jgi:hypothetical protein
MAPLRSTQSDHDEVGAGLAGNPRGNGAWVTDFYHEWPLRKKARFVEGLSNLHSNLPNQARDLTAIRRRASRPCRSTFNEGHWRARSVDRQHLNRRSSSPRECARGSHRRVRRRR